MVPLTNLLHMYCGMRGNLACTRKGKSVFGGGGDNKQTCQQKYKKWMSCTSIRGVERSFVTCMCSTKLVRLQDDSVTKLCLRSCSSPSFLFPSSSLIFFLFFLKKKRDLFTSYIIGGTSNLRDHLFTEYCSTFPFLLFLSVKREPSSPQESL
ncbi:hypothetical protein, unlikely [Trypanosoma brucei gambiense DAL972]|uniref:Uncharacterized protein n=1 Tax=Trypanosoma brucei gambiense (strain MHOM/CI/86/DAL972) TaxID=679716 RepID=C9ZQK5_TRYB9|nr:hypothetical protein, unlikely [Trypanosoma brucei gambiense DAL972]CBH11685.1 hypothetical protein, unlikely [Trypanosoma brucei gambiense DAL972]|eukprot:XP_011773970.1 hypothetical protein, unlikely [Trypanosoma brucei gambiense DAL972]